MSRRYDPAKADPTLTEALAQASEKGILGAALDNMQHRARREAEERDQARRQHLDPIDRYRTLEAETREEFRARAGRVATPEEIRSRDVKLAELDGLARAIGRDAELSARARDAGIDRSIKQRIEQSESRSRDRGGIER